MPSDDEYDEDFDYGEDFDDEDDRSQSKKVPKEIVDSTDDKYDPMNQASYESLDPTTKQFASKSQLEIPPSISPREKITPRSDLSSRSSTSYSSKKQLTRRTRPVASGNRAPSKRERASPKTNRVENANQRQTLEEQEAYIAKLQLANNSLRNQLKDFSRALDSSLKVQAAATSAGGGINAIRSGSDGVGNSKALRTILQNKEKTLAVTLKKLEHARKVITALKKEVQEAYSSERMVQLTNLLHQRELQIQQLSAENKSLLNVQRNQAREIERQDAERQVLPTKMLALQEELRVKNEKLRAVKDKAKHDETVYNKQHEQVVVMMEKNKILHSELRKYEDASGRPKGGSDGKVSARRRVPDDQIQKLQNKVNLVERTARQERIKASAEVRRHREENEKLQRKLKQSKELLAMKEKEMRAQVLEIKKMKRSIRDIALGKEPLPEGPAPWTKNMQSFQGDVSTPTSATPKSVRIPIVEDTLISTQLSSPPKQVQSPSELTGTQESQHHQEKLSSTQADAKEEEVEEADRSEIQTKAPSSNHSETKDVDEQGIQSSNSPATSDISTPIDAERKSNEQQVVAATSHVINDSASTTTPRTMNHETQPQPPSGSAKHTDGPRKRITKESNSPSRNDLVAASGTNSKNSVVNESENRSDQQQGVAIALNETAQNDVQQVQTTEVIDTTTTEEKNTVEQQIPSTEEAKVVTEAKPVNPAPQPVRRGSSKSAFAKPMMKKKKKKQVF